MWRAAASYTRAASSAVSYVPCGAATQRKTMESGKIRGTDDTSSEFAISTQYTPARDAWSAAGRESPPQTCLQGRHGGRLGLQDEVAEAGHLA